MDPMELPGGQPSPVPRKKMTKQLTGKRDDTPLHSAARAGNLGAVMEILTGTGEEELKELLEKQNQSGETALYVAAEYGYVDVVREMIKYYDLADAGIKARNGFDAFHVAAKQGDIGMAQSWNLLFVHYILGNDFLSFGLYCCRDSEGANGGPSGIVYDC
jgi:hypothetical protein